LGDVNISGLNNAGLNISGLNIAGLNISGLNIAGLNVENTQRLIRPNVEYDPTSKTTRR
jgi:hypothetical protein